MRRDRWCGIGMAVLALMVFWSGCSDDSSVPADGAAADMPAAGDSATADSTTADTAVADLGPGSQTLGQPCCLDSTCEKPSVGSCASGLTCEVVSNGPYMALSYCTRSCTSADDCMKSTYPMAECNGTCVFKCTQCEFENTCGSPINNCPPELTCRNPGGLVCIP